MLAMKLSDDDFDRCVQQAIDAIEPEFRKYLDEVPVVVEDIPDDTVSDRLNLSESSSLLGLFRGIPFNKRSVTGSGSPSQIVLYRSNILACCGTPIQLAERIRRTIVHELAHLLGFSEQQLRQHGY